MRRCARRSESRVIGVRRSDRLAGREHPAEDTRAWRERAVRHLLWPRQRVPERTVRLPGELLLPVAHLQVAVKRKRIRIPARLPKDRRKALVECSKRDEIARQILAPRPMTPEQVADLVERVRQNQTRLFSEATARIIGHGPVGRRIMLERRLAHPLKQTMQDKIARYCAEHDVTLSEGARRFKASNSVAYRGWHELFPGVPLPGKGRGHGRARAVNRTIANRRSRR